MFIWFIIFLPIIIHLCIYLYIYSFDRHRHYINIQLYVVCGHTRKWNIDNGFAINSGMLLYCKIPQLFASIKFKFILLSFLWLIKTKYYAIVAMYISSVFSQHYVSGLELLQFLFQFGIKSREKNKIKNTFINFSQRCERNEPMIYYFQWLFSLVYLSSHIFSFYCLIVCVCVWPVHWAYCCTHITRVYS